MFAACSGGGDAADDVGDRPPLLALGGRPHRFLVTWRKGTEGVLDAVAELAGDLLGNVDRVLRHEEHADPFAADQPHDLLDLVEVLGRGAVKSPVVAEDRGDVGGGDLLTVGGLLGDVVISAPQAKRQAEEYGHSLQREMCFLAVHGTLHLLGFDHGTPSEDAEMQRLQEEVLGSLGITR